MIYIGNFIYMSNQQSEEEGERRHGDFSMIIEADGSEQAIDRFRDRLGQYQRHNAFFEGECKIYFVKLLEFDRFPNSHAVMINFKSYAGDPILPFIECAIPSEASDGCKISDWTNLGPSINGETEEVFVSFSASREDAPRSTP
jgi:hypothetical protein